MAKKLKTILFVFLFCLLGAGGFYFFGNWKEAEANPDPSVIDSFTDETMIATTTNLVISTSTGIVKLEKICYVNGVPTTTNWGDNLYGCSGADKRCVNGTCQDCSDNGGYLYSDGCSGCVGQGGNACWHVGNLGESCDTVCSSYGGCNSSGSWTDDNSCTVCRHWYPSADCYGNLFYDAYPCWVKDGITSWDGCTTRTLDNGGCSGSHYGAARICVCDY